MSILYTSPDTTWDNPEKVGYFEPTIYEIHLNASSVWWAIKVTKSGVIKLLNNSSVVKRAFLRREINTSSDVYRDLLPKLIWMPNTADQFTEANTSERQRLWSSYGKSSGICIWDLRSTMLTNANDTFQFPPFGDYYLGIDHLLEVLEQTWKKLDKRIISHGFRPRPGEYYVKD